MFCEFDGLNALFSSMVSHLMTSVSNTSVLISVQFSEFSSVQFSSVNYAVTNACFLSFW